MAQWTSSCLGDDKQSDVGWLMDGARDPPCALQSKAITPHSPLLIAAISLANGANVSADQPAPWWHTKTVPSANFGGV